MSKKRLVYIFSSVLIIVALYVYFANPIGSNTGPATVKKIETHLRNMGFINSTLPFGTAETVLYDLNNKPVKLTDYRGSVVFLNFYATWCPPCREEMPSMQKLHDRYKGKAFRMIAVSIKESPIHVKEFFKKHRLSFTSLLDPRGDAARQFGIGSIPATIILDKTGRILGKAFGPREWDGRKADALFQHLVRI